MSIQSVCKVVLAGCLLLANSPAARCDEPKSYPVLSGVGLALAKQDAHLVVGKVLPGSPAADSGMLPEGSRLLAIKTGGETFSLDGKSVGDAASLIRGPVGTQVVLSFLRPNDDSASSVTLIRQPLELVGVPSATYQEFIGKPIPNLQFAALDGAAAKQLSDYRGRIVVLDLWASWCHTCYAPVAKLQKLSADHPEWAGKVELLTLTVDADPSDAAKVIEQQKWHRTTNLVVDLDELKAIGVTVVPVIIIVAPDGTITTMAGAHALEVEKEIESLLAK